MGTFHQNMKKNSKLHQEDFQKRTRRFPEKTLMNFGQQKRPPNKLSGGCDRKGLSSH